MSSSGQPSLSETVDYTGVLRRRWPIVVAGAVVGLVAALAYVVVDPDDGEAAAQVSLFQRKGGVAAELSGARHHLCGLDRGWRGHVCE